MMRIKIIIADDHQLFREGLVNLLANSDEIEIVARAENGRDAIEKVEKHKPDLILMDIGMPVINGVEATQILHDKYPELKVIALSMHSDKHYIKGMLEAGASGYLLKNSTYNQLLEAIKTVHSGKKYLSEQITEVLIDNYLGKNEDLPIKAPELTDREFEILKLYAEGKSAKEIAKQLFVSTKTVGTHKQNIMEKLHLKSTVEMVRYAIKNGIVSLE
jgi:DNA-binding NarL/FixJ family response regulator